MRIAQITDLHWRKYLPGSAAVPRRHSRRMPELFARALADAKNLGADFIAITGDLLDVPSWLTNPVPGFAQDEPAWWRQAAIEDYRAVRRLLEATGLPSMVLPGNHDDPSLMFQVFDAEAHVQDVGGFRIVRFCDHEHDGHVPRRFTPDRHRWESQLIAEDGVPQIHLQHYVVTPALNEGYPHTYAEGEELRRKMVASGRVRLSLSGHYHHGTPLLREGNCTMTTGPALGDPPFRWRMYELQPASEIVTMTEHQVADPTWGKRRGVFLDRDGVINDLDSYFWGPERMRLQSGSAAAVRQLNDRDLAAVVVTSQSCVGRGYIPTEVLNCVLDKMHRLLQIEAGASVDAVYASLGAGERAVLPKYVDQSDAKPSAFPVHQAVKDRGLDISGSWLVGDRWSDMETAIAAGLEPILVRTGRGRDVEKAQRDSCKNLRVFDDLKTAVDSILMGKLQMKNA